MEKREIILTNRGLHDLNPLLLGRESCEPGHTFGPAVRRYTLLHCVLRGRGVFFTGGERYTVGRGQVFRILPGEITTYRADDDDPWEYAWLGFDGELSTRFSDLPPVFDISPRAMQCFEMEDEEGMPEYRVAASLFRLFEELFAAGPHGRHYVRRVQDYVKASYMQPIRVEEIAERMHLDRRYLSRLFRQKTGQTVQGYLLSVRMQEATRFLMQGISVAETAERCGYSDAFLFSKMFKKVHGVSPANWKKQRENEKIEQKDL